jgi:hypothetical protein
MFRTRTTIIQLVIVTAFAAGGAQLAAQEWRPPRTSREYDVMAIRLYHLGKFSTWPPEFVPADYGETYFVIGVLGRYPFGEQMATIHRNDRWKINDRQVLVRHFPSPEEYRSCHILFIPKQSETAGETERKLLSGARERIGRAPVLIVSDVDDRSSNFVRSGANVVFSPNPAGDMGRGELRIWINAEAVRRFTISDRITNLPVVEIVDGEKKKPSPKSQDRE